VEPLSVSSEDSLGNKTLVYEVSIRFLVIAGAPEIGLDNTDQLGEEDDSGNRSRRRRRDGSHYCPHFQSPHDGREGGQAELAGNDDRRHRPIHDQLGPALGKNG
jgi:hypothetical protein